MGEGMFETGEPGRFNLGLSLPQSFAANREDARNAGLPGLDEGSAVVFRRGEAGRGILELSLRGDILGDFDPDWVADGTTGIAEVGTARTDAIVARLDMLRGAGRGEAGGARDSSSCDLDVTAAVAV